MLHHFISRIRAYEKWRASASSARYGARARARSRGGQASARTHSRTYTRRNHFSFVVRMLITARCADFLNENLLSPPAPRAPPAPPGHPTHDVISAEKAGLIDTRGRREKSMRNRSRNTVRSPPLPSLPPVNIFFRVKPIVAIELTCSTAERNLPGYFRFAAIRLSSDIFAVQCIQHVIKIRLNG